MKSPHRQVLLQSGTSELVCNLPDHPALKVGNSITLKDHDDPSRWWQVRYVSRHVRAKSSLRTTWHNNI